MVDAGHLTFPGNYGDVALEAGKTPLFNLAQPLEDAAKIQGEQASTADTQAATQLRQAELPQEEARSSLATMDLHDQQIARALRSVDWDDPNASSNADAALQKLVDGGNEDAGQYVGKMTPARADELATSLDAGRVRQSAEGAQLAGPAAADGPHDAADLQQRLAQLPPAAFQAAYSHTQDIDAALQRVYHSPDPAKQWDIETKAMGHPELIGRFSRLRLQQMLSETEQALPVMQDIAFRSGLGVAGAPSAVQYKDVGNNIYAIDPYAAADKQVVPVTRNATLIGTDANGRAIYAGPNGQEIVGSHELGPKPGTGPGSVFQQKQDAWLAVHPGDNTGALAYASGNRGAQLNPGQIQQGAAAQAARDLQALSMAGTPPADPQAYLAQQTQLHAAEIQQAQAAAPAPGDTGAAGAAGGPPAPSAGIPPPPQDRLAPDRASFSNSLTTLQQALAANPDSQQLQTALARVRADIAKTLPPMADPGVQIPPRGVALLKQAGEGVPVAFPNGTAWMLKGGQPVRLW